MNNHIPADKLLAEIQRRKQQDITIRERDVLVDIETAIVSLQQEKPSDWSAEDEEMLDAMIDIVANSLYEPLCPREGMLTWLKALRSRTYPHQEQTEVDLEKEWKSYMESRKDDLSGNAVTINMKDLARHFFELGLNAGREKSNGVDGVVHHALKSHWIVTDKNKLAAILKEFPEGAEVELFVCAKKGEKWK